MSTYSVNNVKLIKATIKL